MYRPTPKSIKVYKVDYSILETLLSSLVCQAQFTLGGKSLWGWLSDAWSV